MPKEPDPRYDKDLERTPGLAQGLAAVVGVVIVLLIVVGVALYFWWS